MRRLKSDRGAVAVIVALLMIPILVCAALVIDVGAAYVRRAQLQTAADAGALAIARDCAGPTPPGCGDPTATATNFVAKNYSAGGSVDAPAFFGHSVTVTVRSTVDYSFAPIIRIDSKQVVASSTANWGAPIGGQAILPIAFSYCAFSAQTGGGVPSVTTGVLQFSKSDGTGCAPRSGNFVPGGFGWLKTDRGSDCRVTSTAIVGSQSNILYSDPGASHSCDDHYFTDLLRTTVLLPLFVNSGGSGNGAWYQVYGYAAFHLTGFSFQAAKKDWIEGYFVNFVEPSDAFTYGAGAPDLGARVVYLTS